MPDLIYTVWDQGNGKIETNELKNIKAQSEADIEENKLCTSESQTGCWVAEDSMHMLYGELAEKQH